MTKSEIKMISVQEGLVAVVDVNNKLILRSLPNNPMYDPDIIEL